MRIKMSMFGFMGFLVWCVASIANASLYVEITGGVAAGLPIALVPFGIEGSDSGSVEDLSKIIKSDLENSGQFKALNFQAIKEFPTHQNEVHYAYWQGLGIEDLVVGRVKKTGSTFSVNFALLDVIRQKSEGAARSPLLAMHFDNVRPQDFRALAHHMSDCIFEKLIGVKGIFSTRIAYVSVTEGSKGTTHTLEVADSDGFNPKPLYRSAYPLMSPAWSPDGKRIAFVSFEKNRAGVNIAEVISGHVERLTQFPGINGAPTWSPDNQTLALVLSKDGSPKIYTIDVGSKRLSRLTEGAGIDTEPSFAPDGRSIVFTSSRGGKPQIYRVALDSRKVERLSFKGDYNAKPSLTPDNKKLVMLHRDEGGLFSIAVQTLNTGELKILTRSSLSDSPNLAPNGMMVLYGSSVGGQGVLGAVSLDGRVKIRLPSREGNVQEPAWSPFVK
ncbi:MAG TPA: Tol-Pal system beta propeller repeat protein TolB [Gammaproteobacteria bacterium]|nr:Tol-Pal system beta propeller repeat protein TolB [Gammaproteobacteria bacterium]